MSKSIELSKIQGISIDDFKEMDYLAVKVYGLPIELMMENAGLQLANLIASLTTLSDSVLIGIGNGNNGGGGLVAARRLAAWGYEVYLDIPLTLTKELPLKQLDRALKFGVKLESIVNPPIWVDAYFGFSQRLPLARIFEDRIKKANEQNCIRISLDLPSGFMGNKGSHYFLSHHVLSLGGLKDVLYHLPRDVNLYIADLGIPKIIYDKFGVSFPPFQKSSLIAINVR